MKTDNPADKTLDLILQEAPDGLFMVLLMKFLSGISVPVFTTLHVETLEKCKARLEKLRLTRLDDKLLFHGHNAAIALVEAAILTSPVFKVANDYADSLDDKSTAIQQLRKGFGLN